MTKIDWDAEYYKESSNHLVKISRNEEERLFRVYSSRAAKTLVQLVIANLHGVTKKSMNIIHKELTDNKMFDELRNESGFSQFIDKGGRREQVDVIILNLTLLWKMTENISEPIWFGVEKQIPLQQFEKGLIQRDGFICNITGIPLSLKPPKDTFAKHLRMKSIDHRKPKLKRGKTELDNLQLLADYINERKKQICSICPDPKCEECVLAFPEKSDIVYPTKENISDIKRKNYTQQQKSQFG